ncbi:MAG: hypothetical protein KF760_05850 [Candidatus Eremiobacteraeota bacterium]|nr:hypothetical protein [Candidatus Eremiobacteraeota bacterium]MCW5867082.1 hypothetical protein [Candidatus Eremiobacteraeota bacterium]
MEMSRRQLLLLSLSAVPACAKGVLDWQRENLLIADRLDRSRASGRLYVVKPETATSEAQLRTHPNRYFHRHPIRGQAALANRDTDTLLTALARSLRRYSSSDGVFECFDPRHALRLERNGLVEADLLICFECAQLYYYGKGRPMHGYLRGGGDTFEQVARANGLPGTTKGNTLLE